MLWNSIHGWCGETDAGVVRPKLVWWGRFREWLKFKTLRDLGRCFVSVFVCVLFVLFHSGFCLWLVDSLVQILWSWWHLVCAAWCDISHHRTEEIGAILFTWLNSHYMYVCVNDPMGVGEGGCCVICFLLVPWHFSSFVITLLVWPWPF